MPNQYDHLMLSPEHKRVGALLRQLARASRARRDAEKELRAAIVAAHEGGVSSRRIGEHIDLTHTRVLQIVREERDHGA